MGSGIFGDKTMDEKFMYIFNNDKQNYPFCILKLLVKSLNTTSIESTIYNSMKVPKVFSQPIK